MSNYYHFAVVVNLSEPLSEQEVYNLKSRLTFPTKDMPNCNDVYVEFTGEDED